jgi:hypothetical protein
MIGATVIVDLNEFVVRAIWSTNAEFRNNQLGGSDLGQAKHHYYDASQHKRNPK